MAFEGCILALDIATRTGFAVGEPRGMPEFGSVELPGDSVEERYSFLRKFVIRMIEKHRPAKFIYERPNSHLFRGFTSRDTTEYLCSLCGHAGSAAFDSGLSPKDILTADTVEVRRHFLGRNPKRAEAKRETVARCRAIGWLVSNDDEADACAIWSFARSLADPKYAIAISPLFQKKRRPA